MASRAATRRPWPRRAPSLSRAERRFAAAPISRRRCCQGAINRALAHGSRAAKCRGGPRPLPRAPRDRGRRGRRRRVPPPAGPLVVFLNHPFWGPVMRRVGGRLAASLAGAPREATITYLHPVLSGIFDAVPLLERVRADAPGAGCAVWRTRAPRPVGEALAAQPAAASAGAAGVSRIAS